MGFAEDCRDHAEVWGTERARMTLSELPSETGLAPLMVAIKAQIRNACGPEALRYVDDKCDKESATLVVTIGRRDGPRAVRKDGLQCELRAVLQRDPKRLQILHYAMSLYAPETATVAPRFLRWEFARERPAGTTALLHPLAHLHPGHERLRLPAPVLTIRELVAQFCHIPPWWT
ncbi:MAG: hypothetical protein AB7S36_23165 [Planctomycetota bacterium]